MRAKIRPNEHWIGNATVPLHVFFKFSIYRRIMSLILVALEGSSLTGVLVVQGG